jgi:pimeloyl-ACP methyl ester carboxylesterase
VYLTGHSMGGHMTWRSAYQFPDRFAAVSPMSGGYDYVKSQHVVNLLNVPGYTTYGKQEPYQINEFNNTIATWMREHRYPWTHAEKEGGHQIFVDEVRKIASFFDAARRDLYPARVHARFGAHPYAIETAETNDAWGHVHTWKAGRGILASTVHWLRAYPLPEDTAPEKRVQRIEARNLGSNRFEIHSENVRRLRLYLHPRMIDFAEPVEVVANGERIFHAKVAPQAELMLELVREYDDRGRVFHAAIDLEISSDGEVPEPYGDVR